MKLLLATLLCAYADVAPEPSNDGCRCANSPPTAAVGLSGIAVGLLIWRRASTRRAS